MWRSVSTIPGVFTLSVIGIFINLGGTLSGIWSTEKVEFQGQQIMQFFLIYNTLIIATSILSGIDQPVRRHCDRFPLQKVCLVYIDGNVYNGYTTNLSESGAKIILQKSINKNIINEFALIEFNEDNFIVEAKVIRYQVKNKYLHIILLGLVMR